METTKDVCSDMSGLRVARQWEGCSSEQTHAHTHAYSSVIKGQMSEFLVAARLGRPPRGRGCVKQMASVEKYCCSLHPKHAVCVCVCLFKRQCVTCTRTCRFARDELYHNYIEKTRGLKTRTPIITK